MNFKFIEPMDWQEMYSTEDPIWETLLEQDTLIREQEDQIDDLRQQIEHLTTESYANEDFISVQGQVIEELNEALAKSEEHNSYLQASRSEIAEQLAEYIRKLNAVREYAKGGGWYAYV